MMRSHHLLPALTILAVCLPAVRAADDPGQNHWAFRKLVRPARPTVRAIEQIRTPVDAFLLARLEAINLGYRPPADAYTLVRRATFDLTGLPPTHAEIDAFVRELSAKPQAAYEALLD